MAMQLTLEMFRSTQAADPYAFQAGCQDYVLRTALGGAELATLLWDETLLAELLALRQPRRDPTLLQRVGERLRQFLATPSFARSESELLAAVARGESVLITLRLAAAELFALPWELLALSGSGLQLGALPGVLLRYAWPQTQTSPPSEVVRNQEGGRVLFAWSAAGGAVPAAEHEAALRRACQLGPLPMEEVLQVLPQVTSQRLAQQLAARQATNPVTMLHILCHGVQRDGAFGLSWDSPDGDGSEVLDAGLLRQLLAPFAGELRLVVLAACDSGNCGPLGSHLGSVAQALHRAGIAAVVASRYPLSVAGSVMLTEQLYGALYGEPASLEQAFIRARQQLAQQSQNLDWAALQLYARPEDGDDSRPVLLRPYQGLSPFLPGQSRFFFGREAERAQARAALVSLQQAGKPRFLLVMGASGTGKSSVVLGGLLPDIVAAPSQKAVPSPLLRSAEELLRLVRAQSQQPQTERLRETLQALLQELQQLTFAGGDGQWEWAVLRPGNQPLASLQQALSSRQAPSLPLLLIVDQLEELFTHCESAATRSELAQRLWSLAQGPSGVFVVATLRVDFIGRLGELQLDDSGLQLDRIAYQDAHRVFVSQPGPEQLATAIVAPAQRVGLTVQPPLTDRIVSEVAGEPGALPLLSYVLDLLWQQREGRQLSARVYSELGGVRGALGRSADRVYLALSTDDQRLARQLLVQLVAFSAEVGGETRRRVSLQQLREATEDPTGRLETVLAAFVQARLLVYADDAGTAVVEFAHESLIRHWERLQQLLRVDRQRLLEVRELLGWAAQFAAFGSLLQGAQLGYAQRLQQKYPGELGPQVSALIAHSMRARRRSWGLRAVALSTVMLMLGALSVKALRSEQRALLDRQVAMQKERTAKARLLAMHAEQAASTEPDTALLYAAQALQLHREYSTRSALLKALVSSQSFFRFLRLPPGRVHSAAFTPDSRLVVAAVGLAGLLVFDVQQGRQLAQRLAQVSPCRGCEPTELYAVAVSPDGQTIAATGQAGQIFMWRTEQVANAQQPALVVPTGARTLYSLDFSPDGGLLVAGAGDGTVVRVDVGRRVATTLPGDLGSAQLVSAVAFQPGHGGRVAVAGSSGAASVLEVATGAKVLGPLFSGQGYLSSLAFSPSGRWLAAASEDRGVLLWDSQTGKPQPQADAAQRGPGALSGVSFGPDGRWLASCGLDRALRLWEVDSLRPLGAPQLAPGGEVYSCSVSPDGRLLASGSDGQLLLWDLTAHPTLHVRRQPLAVSALTMAPIGDEVILGGPDGSLRFWDLSQPAPGSPLSVHSRAINAVTYSSDGSVLATGSSDGSTAVLAAATRAPRRTFSEPGHGGVMAVALTPGGDYLGAGYADGTLALYSLASGPARPLIATRQQSITALAVSPDGRWLWSGGLDGSIRSFSIGSGAPSCASAATRPQHGDAVTSLSMSPRGDYLASGSRDQKVLLFTWERSTGCLTQHGQPLQEHRAAVTALAFSREGDLLASGDEAAAVVLWDVHSEKVLGLPLRGHLRPITGLAFARDGLLWSSDSQTVWQWPTSEAQWLTQACLRAGRNLSLAEWQRGLGDTPYCRICKSHPPGAQALPSTQLCTP